MVLEGRFMARSSPNAEIVGVGNNAIYCITPIQFKKLVSFTRTGFRIGVGLDNSPYSKNVKPFAH